MPRPLHPISRAARDALADRYAEHAMPDMAAYVRSGQADHSILTPALEALTAASAEIAGLREDYRIGPEIAAYD